MAREVRTITAMVRLYCHDQHGTDGALCPDCAALLSYARERLARCPFQERKPICARCPVHCYRPDMRDRIRDVMRYAGPRMLVRHPILALLHLLDRLRCAHT
ncbi:MAG: nitrous oxide-stimulated promoter family protein [Anaerolineae bacterium]|nr:nitrous oxide-stimulated promoter family protein [Anaerolineae bacterium]